MSIQQYFYNKQTRFCQKYTYRLRKLWSSSELCKTHKHQGGVHSRFDYNSILIGTRLIQYVSIVGQKY
jgi:hypothetical protein